MLDFSNTEDLRPLARLVRALRKESAGLPFLLAGAQARDLLLKHAHGIEVGRQTSDVDFAFRVGSWNEFHGLRQRLIGSGHFTEVPKAIHKLRFRGELEVDIVPFGGIERDDRMIEWPPEGDVVMSMFGFREVLDAAELVKLPEGEHVRTVSLPALALLKFSAWQGRRRIAPGKDAYDLRLILTNYVDAGNDARLYDEFASLVAAPDFAYEDGGAFMLGHDIGKLLDEAGRSRLSKQLVAEADEGGQLSLVGDLQIGPERGIRLINAVHAGLISTAEKR